MPPVTRAWLGMSGPFKVAPARPRVVEGTCQFASPATRGAKGRASRNASVCAGREADGGSRALRWFAMDLTVWRGDDVSHGRRPGRDPERAERAPAIRSAAHTQRELDD